MRDRSSDDRTGQAGHDDTRPVDGLVREFRDAVGRRLPDDVEPRPADGGFAVGYPEPLVMTMGSQTTSTTLWSVVRCDPITMTFQVIDTITDHEVSRFGAGAAVGGFRRRVSGDRVARAYGRRADGTTGLVRKQVHSVRVLHKAIREPAAELGWAAPRPATAIVGLTFGVIGGVGALVALAVLGVLLVTGRLG